MKKFLLSTAVIIAFIAYALNQKTGIVVLSENTSNASTSNSSSNLVTSKTKSTTPVPVNVRRNYGDDNEDDSRGVIGNIQNQTTVTSNSTNVPAPTPVVKTNPSVATVGKYRNGSYVGSSAYAYSDYIQVTAVISGGKLTDIQFPNSTGGPNRSVQIYSYAMPQLKSEAISVQDSNVNTISGATYTSEAFRQSLASALAQALN